MKPELRYCYHDGCITGVTIGPRREVNLQVSLDSVWNGRVERTVNIRFGGVNDLARVVQYCELLAQLCNAIRGVRIDDLKYDLAKHSSPNSHWMVLDAEGCGTAQIHCHSVQESEVDSE